jgi:hypothetical protein
MEADVRNTVTQAATKMKSLCLVRCQRGMGQDQPWVDPVPYFLRDDLIHYF